MATNAVELMDDYDASCLKPQENDKERASGLADFYFHETQQSVPDYWYVANQFVELSEPRKISIIARAALVLSVGLGFVGFMAVFSFFQLSLFTWLARGADIVPRIGFSESVFGFVASIGLGLTFIYVLLGHALNSGE